MQRFEELSRNLPGGKVRLWESRGSELSGTSEIIKIGPIAKKLLDFKVGQISDAFLEKSKITLILWEYKIYEPKNVENQDFDFRFLIFKIFDFQKYRIHVFFKHKSEMSNFEIL